MACAHPSGRHVLRNQAHVVLHFGGACVRLTICTFRLNSSTQICERRDAPRVKTEKRRKKNPLQVFIFIVHDLSTSAFATAGLAGTLSQPHLQTLNDLSRRPKVMHVKHVIFVPYTLEKYRRQQNPSACLKPIPRSRLLCRHI